MMPDNWGFVIAAYGSFLAYAVLVGKSRVWKAALVITVALIVIAVGGSYLVPTATPHHIAHLVQTNFPQSEQYPSDWMQVHAGELDQLAQVSIDAAKKTPGLVVWPEVPAPFSMQDPSFAARMVRIAKESGSEFLVGVVDWQKNATGSAKNQWSAYNSAVLLDASGRRTYAYNKIHLVPFGEYVPLRKMLFFAHKLVHDEPDIAANSVQATTVTSPSEPLIPPSQAAETSTSALATPPWRMKVAAMTNSGSDINVGEFR